MGDIQVGEFIRTKYGDIGKYVIKQNIDFIETNNGYIGFNIEEDIVKHSKNIIDLIEIGDYVNGYKVDFIQNDEVVFNHNHPRQINIFAEEIKSIVTKEQFNSVKYEVER